VKIEDQPGDAATTAQRLADAPQHMQALARANRVRLARAELKRSIVRGDVSAADVIRDAPWEVESMTLAELLTSQRRWGRTRARKFLLEFAVSQGTGLSENKRIGTLSNRQRALLAMELHEVLTTETQSAAQVSVSDEEQDDLWSELSTVIKDHDELTGELRQLTARRDELIRKLSDAGASRRSVAEAASLTVGRVQQILNEPRASLPATSKTMAHMDQP
jgi:hypothetical protein